MNVLYLALGPYRTRAARVATDRLLAQGHHVRLLGAALPVWEEAGLDPRVELTLLPLASSGARGTSGANGAAGAAGKRRGKGPGALVARGRRAAAGIGDWRAAQSSAAAAVRALQPELVVAGDAHALPLAWSLRHRHPELSVVTELPDGELPDGEPTGAGAPVAECAAAAGVDPRRLAVVTPWYPSPNNPFAGSFVQAATAAVTDRFREVEILHTEDWTGPASPLHADAVRIAAEALIAPGDAYRTRTAEGLLTRVPVPVQSKRDYAAWVDSHTERLRAALPGGRIDADLVHAHVGIYGGVIATRLAAPGTRIVVTEHATFLERIFRQPAARRLYDEMLGRVDALMCVGRVLYDQVAAAFPHRVEKLRLVPNVIDFDRLTARPEPPRALDRWLYLGRLIEQKGVDTLLDAFAEVAAENPRARLTLVGSGVLEERLRLRAEELGVSARVELRGPVPPEQVLSVMHEHDLLTHASRLETFGMTVVEAVAAGLPVLVTRSGGPDETMAGLEGVAGRLVDVPDDPADTKPLVTGYRTLVEELPKLDLPGARATLESRYGSAAVAARLMEVYAPGSPVPAPRPPAVTAAAEAPAAATAAVAAGARSGSVGAGALATAEAGVPSDDTSAATGADANASAGARGLHAPRGEASPAAGAHPDPAPGKPVGGAAPTARVLLLALNTPHPDRVLEHTRFLLARGVQVDLVTVDESRWRTRGLDPRVRLHSLRGGEGRHPIPRTERVVVRRGPQLALGALTSSAARTGDLRLQVATGAVQRGHARAADAFHRKVFLRGYRVIRPYLLWRVARRELLAVLDPATLDAVNVCDANSIPIGYHLAQDYPGLTVRNSLDRSPFEDLPVIDPAADPAADPETGPDASRDNSRPDRVNVP